MLKNLDQEVKAEIEAVLKKDGFFQANRKAISAPTPRRRSPPGPRRKARCRRRRFQSRSRRPVARRFPMFRQIS